MCGICGVAGNLDEKDIKAFKQLLFISALRGRDSTGVCTIKANKKKKKEEIKIYKEATDSPYFLYKKREKGEEILVDAINSDIIMGHCRDATVGEVNDENAHPFDLKNLVATHNGTLYNMKFNNDNDKTDSQLLFEEMSEKGVIDTLDTVSPSSAFAVALYEKGSETLTLSRNDERTLYVGVAKDKNVIYWASEASFLDLISTRVKIDMDIYYLQPYKVYRLPINYILSGDKVPWEIEDLVDKSAEYDAEAYSIMYSGFGYYGDNNYNNDYSGYGDEHSHKISPPGAKTDTAVAEISRISYGEKSNIEPHPWDLDCDSCGGVIKMEDMTASRFDFDGTSIYMCEDCRNNNHKNPAHILEKKLADMESKNAA